MPSFPERRLLRPPPSLPIRHPRPAPAPAVSPILPPPPAIRVSRTALMIALARDAAPVRLLAPRSSPNESDPDGLAPDGLAPDAPEPPAVEARPQPPALAAGAGQLLLPGLDLPLAPVQFPARRAAPIAARPDAPAREALASYPDVAAADLCRHAKTLGRAGELLVDSLFARLGERLLEAPEHEAYDRILWLPDQALRVQIKTRHRASGGQWVFTLTRGYQRGPGGTRPYAPGDYDILAAVLLSEGVVSFAPRGLHRHCIPLSAVPRLRARPRDSLDATLRALGHAAAIPPRPQAAA